MSTLTDLPTPALVVDLDRLERNIGAMAERARRLGVAIRPHVKTHKCIEIGRMQQAAGAHGITVATLHEAEVFATAGFQDILWAFPIIPSRVAQAVELSRRVRLGVVVDCEDAVAVLAGAGTRLPVWIKVDCGYHRCGAAPEPEGLAALAGVVAGAGLELAGVLSHSGDAYDAVGEEARARAAEAERACLVSATDALRAAGHAVPAVSVGSTPAMTAVRELDGVTEVRPGNYVYFDRTQVGLGSCEVDDCALSVVSTVVSTAPDHAVIDAGALALSKDAGPRDGSYGALFEHLEGGGLRRDVTLVGLSQEHGKLDRPLRYGERVRVLPNHSCLTAACFTHVHAARGLDVVARWRVWNGR